MESLLELIQHLIDPDWIMQNGGLYLVLLILFIETGVFFGFFLPGDPLLFVSGMLIASADEGHYPFDSSMLNLPFWMVLFMTATILGNYFGYWFGYKFKFLIEEKKDTWFFKRRHLETARDFYQRKGGFTIAIARFLPVIRTFAPIIAGMVKMDMKKFSLYNILGAAIWVVSLTSIGYILGDNAWVKRNLEFVILGIVLIVTAPVIIKFLAKK